MKRLLPAVALTPCLLGGAAWANASGAAVYVSLIFGAGDEGWGVDLGWGAELHVTFPLDELPQTECHPARAITSATGPFLRLAFRGLEPRVFGGLYYGHEAGAGTLGGELGLGAVFDGPGPSLGLLTQLVASGSDFEGFLGADWLAPAVELGVGATAGDRLGFIEASCIVGRPCRSAEGALLAPPTAAPLGDAVLDRWAAAAAAEGASIAAFWQLALDLQALGAPPALVARALQAADDEVHHTALCAGVIAQLGGTPPALALPVRLRAPLAGAAGLARLAAESYVDGCLGEGRAAAEAALAARLARHPGARAAQRRIARDEAAHARLGWDVLAWAVGRGGLQRQVAALRDARGEAVSPIEVPPSAVDQGQLPNGLLAEVAARHAVAARARLDRLLA